MRNGFGEYHLTKKGKHAFAKYLLLNLIKTAPDDFISENYFKISKPIVENVNFSHPEKKDGDNIVCYVCGQNLSKSHICIPYPNCLSAGWPIQDNMSRPPLLPSPQFFEFPF